MRKANRREYKAIVDAKMKVDSVMEECNYDISKICNFIMRQTRILDKLALATVFCTGGFVNGTQFMLPATKDCCANFKNIEKHMKQKCSVSLYNENCWTCYDSVIREYEMYRLFDGKLVFYRVEEE